MIEHWVNFKHITTGEEMAVLHVSGRDRHTFVAPEGFRGPGASDVFVNDIDTYCGPLSKLPANLCQNAPWFLGDGPWDSDPCFVVDS